MISVPFEYVQLIVALVLGAAIGLERSVAHKTAGMRTYGLVSMGACLFVMAGRLFMPGIPGNNVFIIASTVVTGIGFLCGGVIIFQNHQLSGLTTAAGIWITAAVGVTVGFGLVPLAIFATITTLVVLTIFWFVEKAIIKDPKSR